MPTKRQVITDPPSMEHLEALAAIVVGIQNQKETADAVLQAKIDAIRAEHQPEMDLLKARQEAADKALRASALKPPAPSLTRLRRATSHQPLSLPWPR